jgi:hypothetical protein
VHNKRFFGTVSFQACRNKAFVEEQRGLNSRPSFSGVDYHFKSHIKMALDFVDRMLFSDLGVGEGPEDSVQSHEKSLHKYPRQVNGSGEHLFAMHGNVENGCFITCLRSIDTRFGNLWRRPIHKNNDCVSPSLEPEENVSDTTSREGLETYHFTFSPLPSSFFGQVAIQ